MEVMTGDRIEMKDCGCWLKIAWRSLYRLLAQ